MPFSSEISPLTFSGNGSTTEFSITFLYLDTSHVKVVHVSSGGTETAYTLNTQFTLTAAGNESGGTLTTATGYTVASGASLRVWLDIPLTQTTRYRQAGADSASTKNADLDRIWQAISVLNEQVARCYKLPFRNHGSDMTGTTAKADTLGKYAIYNSTTGLLDATAVVTASQVVAASESAQGIAELVTDTEAIDGVGTTGPDNARIVTAAKAGGWIGRSTIVGGRWSGTSGTPTTTSDVTAITTLYWVPFLGGNLVPIYNGTRWQLFKCGDNDTLTLDTSGHTANNNYDIFAVITDPADLSSFDFGTGPAWSSATSRGTGAGTTELEIYQGRYVNKVAMTARNGSSTYSVAARSGTYLGTFRTTGSNGQTEDSLAKRYIWNAYNRRARAMRVTEATNTWAYTTATMRQANGAAGNQLDFVQGLNEDAVSADVMASVENSSANVLVMVGIGLDATDAIASGSLTGAQVTAVAAQEQPLTASYRGFPGLGRHYLAWLEYSAATGTTTWYGDNNVPLLTQSGIHGIVWG